MKHRFGLYVIFGARRLDGKTAGRQERIKDKG